MCSVPRYKDVAEFALDLYIETVINPVHYQLLATLEYSVSIETALKWALESDVLGLMLLPLCVFEGHWALVTFELELLKMAEHKRIDSVLWS